MNELTIPVIENDGQRFLTTAQIAELYGTDSKVISYNFNNNKNRYVEGKHYYNLKGDALRAIREFHELPKNINSLYLWTEKGALLHAKSLNTDKAWEVYDYLVENYFRVRSKQMTIMEMIAGIANNAVELERRLNAAETRRNELESRIEQVSENRKELIQAVFEYGRISHTAQKHIEAAVKLRSLQVYDNAKAYEKMGKRIMQMIYSALHKKYKIDSYKDLANNQFNSALIFIDTWQPSDKVKLEIMQAMPKVDMNAVWDLLFNMGDEEEKLK